MDLAHQKARKNGDNVESLPSIMQCIPQSIGSMRAEFNLLTN